ncbi:MAG: hypothetical protein AB7H97_10965 [Pseudobdellovibrionaceae bacterium]
MKKSFKVLFFATAVTASLIACTEEKREKVNKHDRSKKAPVGTTSGGKRETVEVNEKMDVPKLLAAGEKLVTSGTFNLADITFDMVLKKERNNEKALFYKHFLKRFMVLKGILKRIRPLAKEMGSLERLDKAVDKSKDYPGQNFLLGLDDKDIKEDITTGAELESVISLYAQAIAEFHGYLHEMRNNRVKELVLNTSVDLRKNIKRDISKLGSDRCIFSPEKNNKNNFKITCTFFPTTPIKLGEPDILALSQLVAGERLLLAMFSNYSIEGIEKLKNFGGLRMIDTKELQSEIEKVETIGKRKNKNADNLVKRIESLGADAISAFEYMQKHAEKLCPSGKFTKEFRKGYYFSNGICVANNDITKNIAILGEALKGVVTIDIRVKKHMVSSKVDLLALARNPVDHLSKISPSAYQTCKRVGMTEQLPKSLRDNTLGGTLVDGIAADLLTRECDESLSTVETKKADNTKVNDNKGEKAASSTVDSKPDTTTNHRRDYLPADNT